MITIFKDQEIGDTIVKFVQWTITTLGTVLSMLNLKTFVVGQDPVILLTKRMTVDQTLSHQGDLTAQKTRKGGNPSPRPKNKSPTRTQTYSFQIL